MNSQFFVSAFLFALLPLFSVSPVSAQDNISNSAGIGFGISNFHILDEHANLLIFRGKGIAPSIHYNRMSPKNTHIIRGVFYYDNLSTTADNFNTEIIGGQIRYAYLRSVFTGNDMFSAGLSFASIFLKSDYYFYSQVYWLKAIESWYWSHSIDLVISLKKEWNKNTFRLRVFMPVVSNVSRPAYSSSGDYNYEKNDWVVKPTGRTLFLTKNIGFNSHLGYSRNLSDKFSMNAEYEFYFYQNRTNELIKLYTNNFRLGLSYNF